MKKFHIHIDSSNVDTFSLVHKNIPKKKQKTGKRLPFFYFWLKDHFYQKSPDLFPLTEWSFSDDPLPIRKNPALQKKLLNKMPDIVGLGIFIWNKDIALDNIKWYKENNPNMLIVAGGPSAEATKEFIEDNPAIDVVILGPGIEIFKRVIEAHMERENIKEVEGVSYLKDGRIVRNKPLPRHHDPLVINYIENFRDEVIALMDDYLKIYDRIIFQTYFIHGCPYSCSFCEQGTSLWTKINRRPIEFVHKEIDFLVQFKNVQYEFLDQNFGIVKDYIDLVKYFIKKNADHNVSLRFPTMAKNNVDTVFEIIDLINSSSTNTSMPNYSYIALQDTNPDVLKLNGRPISREYEKIKKFKEITKHHRYKLNQVDLIIGLPGQSFETLSVTLYNLFKEDLLGQKAPNLYTVLPNTTLTAEDNEIYFKQGTVWHREKKRLGMNFIDFDDLGWAEHEYNLQYLIGSETINSTEITSAHYMFILLSHVSGMIRWLETPLNYLKNYHGKTNKDFIKTYTKFFKPQNRHLLPDCVAEDLASLDRWFSGKDKFFSRRDNQDLGFLVFDTMAKYRFHFNCTEMSDMFHRMFIEIIGEDTVILQGIMKWQNFLTWMPEKNDLDIVSYNYDDIALKKSDICYLSKWQVKFDTLDLSAIIEKFKYLKPIHYIPELICEEIDPSLQKPLELQMVIEQQGRLTIENKV